MIHIPIRLALVVSMAAGAAALASDYTVLAGRLSFAVPTDWREVRRVDHDSVSFVAFVVPRPSGDSLAPAGNVMVDAALSHRKSDLRTYSDAKLKQEAAGPGSPVVVDDRLNNGDSSRTVLSTSRLRGTPYALWDMFVVRDSVYVDIRTAIPVAYAADSVWEARYESQLNVMLRSFRVGRTQLFR